MDNEGPDYITNEAQTVQNQRIARSVRPNE